MEKLGALININANRGQDGINEHKAGFEAQKGTPKETEKFEATQEQMEDPNFDAFLAEAQNA